MPLSASHGSSGSTASFIHCDIHILIRVRVTDSLGNVIHVFKVRLLLKVLRVKLDGNLGTHVSEFLSIKYVLEVYVAKQEIIVDFKTLE